MRNIIHYTDGPAFLNILKNQELWASDAKYLNDYNEINHGKNIFIKELGLLGDNGLEGSASDITTSIIEFLSWRSVGIISFSQEADLLSQWRGYCPTNGGYAIELQQESMFNDSDIIINSCIYDKNDQETIAKKYSEQLKPLVGKQDINKERDIFPIINEMFATICCFKNHGFYEEKEVRIIVPPRNRTLYFRERGGLIIPFYKIKFNLESVRRIWIGPMKDSDLAERATQLFLDSLIEDQENPLNDKPEISISQVSLRS